MIKNSLLILSMICITHSCVPDKKPKIVYGDRNADTEIKEIKKDTQLIEIADLQIEIDSIDYLIHPIGNIKIYKSRSKFSSKSWDYNTSNFSVSNHSVNQITGDFTNLKFQHIDSDKLISLTEKTLKIKSVTFLRDVFDQTKSKYLLYNIIDNDTNQDNLLDYHDLKSLYISKIDGSSFTKITPEYQELVNWKILLSKNRLYFKTIEDINKDGVFDKADSIHYHYLDLEDKDGNVKEYDPL